MLIRLLFFFFTMTAHATSLEMPHQAIAVVGDVKIVNKSGSNVYWHFKQGADKEIVGLLKTGQSDSLVNVTFFPKQEVTIKFKCNKADTWTCAEGAVDITQRYPSSIYDNVVTVFTYNNQGVELSFEASSINETKKPKRIVIGNISKAEND